MSLSLYTIPASQPFLRTLARTLLDKHDSFHLAQHLILLPTRRSCLELSHLFFEENQHRPLILPRILPLGEIEEEEFSLTSPHGATLMEGLPDLMSPQRRQLLLASLISRFTYGGDSLSFDHAARLAQDLMGLIDDLRMEDIPLEALESLNPLLENAEHWQRILGFLKIISNHWDKILKDENLMEASSWQRMLMEKQAALWQENPPSHPILVAGSMGTIPSTAHLMKVVARLPKGTVILPGLERDLKELSSTHPQYALYELLKTMGCEASLVQNWVSEEPSARQDLIRGSFIDPSQKMSEEQLSKALENVNLMEVSDQMEEAQVIALALRKNLEQNKKRSLFITADASLAKRVALELQRWNIHIPSGKGTPFWETDWGSLMGLTATWFQKDFNMISLLSTLKHALAIRFEAVIPTLEVKIIRRTWGLKSPYDLVLHFEDSKKILTDEDQGMMQEFLEGLMPLLKKTKPRKSLPFQKFLEIHKSILEWIVPNFEIEKTSIGDFWVKLEKASSQILLSTEDYSQTLRALTQNVFLPNSHHHDFSIQILTPLESRLLQTDFIILGGLNEGTWPEEVRTDPFFSRSMRAALGLPPSERRIGQSTHDFVSAIHAPQVLLTRALRVEGAPTVPSKFLARLESYLQAHNRNLPKENFLREWRLHLETPHHVMPISEPIPQPPVSLRPLTLSISDVASLMQNPYSIYAKYVLKVSPLKELYRPAGVLEFGLFVHEFLQVWMPNFSEEIPLEQAKELFQKYFNLNEDKKFWWGKFEHIVRWVFEVQSSLLPAISKYEVWGSLSFSTLQGPFTLKGRADRIDMRSEGLTVIDYKTGQPPSEKNIGLGISPQLALEAAMILHGKFEHIPARPLRALQFWSLAPREGRGAIFTLKTDPLILGEQAFEGLKTLIDYFLQLETPYLSHPRGLRMPGSYDHLARIKEWLIGGDAECL